MVIECNHQHITAVYRQELRPFAEMAHIVLAKTEEELALIMEVSQSGYKLYYM